MATTGLQPGQLVRSILDEPSVQVARRFADEGVQGALAATPATGPVTARLADVAARLGAGVEQARAGERTLRDAADAARAADPGADVLDGVELLARTPEALAVLLEHNPALVTARGAAVAMDGPIHADVARLIGTEVARATYADMGRGKPPLVRPMIAERQVGNVAGYARQSEAELAAKAAVREHGGTVLLKRFGNAEGFRYLLVHTGATTEGVEVGRLFRRTEHPAVTSLEPEIQHYVASYALRATAANRDGFAPLSLEQLRAAGATETFRSPALQLDEAADTLAGVADGVAARRAELTAHRRLAALLESVPTAPGSGGPMDWEGALSLITVRGRGHGLRPMGTGNLTIPAGGDMYSAVAAAKASPGTPFVVLQDTTGRFHLARVDGSLEEVAVVAARGGVGRLHPDARALVVQLPDGPSVITPRSASDIGLYFLGRPDGAAAPRSWNPQKLARQALANLWTGQVGPRDVAPHRLVDLSTEALKVGMDAIGTGGGFVVARGADDAPWLVAMEAPSWNREYDFTADPPPGFIGYADKDNWMPVDGPPELGRFTPKSSYQSYDRGRA